jgi:hypothetical protein
LDFVIIKNEILIEIRRIIILKKDKIKNNLVIVLLILFSVLFLYGCHSIGNGVVYPTPGKGRVLIDKGAETTDTRTPFLTIYAEGADYMSFSGGGELWTEWIPYDSSYEDFDIASGLYGTETGLGTKYVYARFKDLTGNILFENELIYDTIIYTPPPSPTEGSIVIADGNEITDDSTPLLTIYAEGADYMSFSGDGEEWSEWIPYAESYEDFDIASGECGTEFSQGEKYVYVRFKNENGDLSPQDDLAGDDISYRLSNLDLKYIKVEPTRLTMKVNTSQVFIAKGIDRNLNEVPLDGSKVSWSYCCNASTTPLSGSVTTTYTAPGGAGNKWLKATYEGKYQKSTWITVIN